MPPAVTNSITLAGDVYHVSPMPLEMRWLGLESDGRWQIDPAGVTGEWLASSPSLFLAQKIAGPYLWQVRVTRLRTDASFLERFSTVHHTNGWMPDGFYNFNFWLRADSPDGGDFLRQYPQHLGSGWNGMGDDFWRSYFTTIVRQPDQSWCRLRRSPGYEMVVDTALPAEANYDEPHDYAFVVGDGFVRAYCDGRRVYDHRGEVPPAGYIGLCVWLCKVRFDQMKLFRLTARVRGVSAARAVERGDTPDPRSP